MANQTTTSNGFPSAKSIAGFYAGNPNILKRDKTSQPSKTGTRNLNRKLSSEIQLQGGGHD